GIVAETKICYNICNSPNARTRARSGKGADMFRLSDRQGKLFDAYGLMTPHKKAACEKSWAGPFHEKALPVLLGAEPEFAEIYDERMGRPNCPVALLAGLHILKEMHNLTDMEALGALEFDTRWWYAFGLEPDEAKLCQKTLHNFREAVMRHEKGHVVFRKITDKLIAELGISVTRQRLDSTHILSNFAVLNRLGLFCETLRFFLHELKKTDSSLYETIGVGILKRYSDDSRYHDARKEEGRRRLSVAARDLYRLVERFKGNAAVEKFNEYGLMKRLLSDQCEISDKPEPPAEGDDDGGEPPVPVKLKIPKEVESASLQTPHDEDVTYSGHKGKGYEVQLAESCVESNAVELITEVQVTPSSGSDNKALLPVIESLEKSGHKPEELIADTGYSGAKNASKAAGHGVNLCAPAPARGKPKPGVSYPVPSDKCPIDKKEAGEWLKCREAQQPEFGKRQAIRAGIEGTNSELKRRHGLRKLRVRGGVRVKLAVYFKVTACNLKRALNYWNLQRLKSSQAVEGAVAHV
ncbi:MAG: transposase, partial [Acidobacteriota bacterium]